jgi:DNA-binding MarR family transcriptional regulator
VPTKFDATIDLTLDLLKAINEARDGTTVQQAEVFLALVMLTGDAEKVVAQHEIAAYLRRPQGPISKQIDKWVEAGLLEKEFAPGSQLYRQYPLTAKGKALLTKLRQIIDRAKG